MYIKSIELFSNLDDAFKESDLITFINFFTRLVFFEKISKSFLFLISGLFLCYDDP